MKRTRRRTPLTSAVVALALVGVLAACSHSDATPVASVASLPPSSAAPTPSPTPTEVQRSLLSGREGEVDGPVLAVKLDNTRYSNPHAGLQAADVVYIEQVEGGLSRYVAVFSTRVPTSIGPIRSARIADLELLPQYGRLAFAYSGANPKLRPVLARAPFYDVSGDRGSVGYWRQSGRFPPYNFFGNGKQLLARAPNAEPPNDVGFTFSELPAITGRSVKSVTTAWPSARAMFTWSAKQDRWLLTMDGAPANTTDGKQLGGTTVIIQYVTIHPSIYGLRSNTPMSDTVGRGKALILRDGMAYNARWSRPKITSGTTWTVGGQEFALAPGQVWVMLANKTSRASEVRAKNRPVPSTSS